MRITTVRNYLVDAENAHRRNYHSVQIIVITESQTHYFHLRNWQNAGSSFSAKISQYHNLDDLQLNDIELIAAKEKRSRVRVDIGVHDFYDNETLPSDIVSAEQRLDYVTKKIGEKCRLSTVNRKKLYNTIYNVIKVDVDADAVTVDAKLPDAIEPEEKRDLHSPKKLDSKWGMF